MNELVPPPRISPPPKIPPAPTHNYDSLVAGLICLVIGIGSEAVLHPIIPWTFMPGTIFVMIGLGVGLAVLEKQYPKPGMICFYIGTAGVMFWYIGAMLNISYLAPMLYFGMFQLSRCVLRLTFDS